MSRARVVQLVALVLGTALVLSCVTLVAGATSLRLPAGVNRTLAAQTYDEQVRSQGSISDLISNRVSSFSVVKRSRSGDSATLRLKVSYRDGRTGYADMALWKLRGTWYFRSLTRVGGRRAAASQSFDTGVVNTVFKEQLEHQGLMRDLVTGRLSRATITGVASGHNVKSVKTTWTGSGRTVTGKVNVISRTRDGQKLWFVTSLVDQSTTKN